jgi:IclR family acetate operon transcriptional repressor
MYNAGDCLIMSAAWSMPVAARNHIDLVGKTMRVLEELARSQTEVCLKDLAQRVGLVKSSVFRILFSLKELGFVEQKAANGSYRLTVKVHTLVRGSASSPTLIHIAQRYLRALRDHLQESVWLAEWRRGAVILIDVVEARHPLRLSFTLGDHCPLHATALGKSIAAHMDPVTLESSLGRRLQRYTAQTKTNRQELLAELARVRDQGFALNREEILEGAILVGAPVFDSLSRAFAAISVSCPTARCTPAKRRAMIVAVVDAGKRISRDLAQVGFRSPDPPLIGALGPVPDRGETVGVKGNEASR